LDRSLNYHEEFHGTDGPIHTSFNEAALPIEFDFVNACEETSGVTEKAIDPWSGDHLGIHHVLTTVTRKGPNKGKRSYAAREYYAPNHTRSNLKVLCETRVNKVILDDDNKATGVSIFYDGNNYEVTVAREVILSAGTVFSPHILELSGIGDPAILKAAGIPCKVENAAIGANLQDHVISFVTWESKPDVMTGDVMRLLPEAMPAAIKQYAETKSGPLAAVPNIMGFYSAKSLLSDQELKDVIQSIGNIEPANEFHAKQLEQVITNLEDEKSSNVQVVLVPALMNPQGDPKNHGKLFSDADPEKSGITAVVGIQNPVSRGFIHTQSSGRSEPGEP
jgi:choline dehydrogenase-like flavoprotein